MGRGFSIQTNGNLPNVHINRQALLSGSVPTFITIGMAKDIQNYVARYGTDRQLMMAGASAAARNYNALMKQNKRALYSVGQDGKVGNIIAINPPQRAFKESYVKNLSELDGFKGSYVKESTVGIFKDSKSGGDWVGMSVSKQTVPKKVYINGRKIKKNNPNFKNKRKIRFGKTN